MSKNTRFWFLILAAGCLPFFYWLYQRIHLDFWWDEIYTLKNSVLVPLWQTLTTYPAPNHHIFSNLLNNLYLNDFIGLFKHPDLISLMENPATIRIFMVVYTLITIFYIYRIAKAESGSSAAVLAVIVLISTIPYYNMVLQVRGYSLSTMLFCMLLYYLGSFERSAGVKDGFLVILLAALMLYTIPSNLYFLLSMMVYYAGVLLTRLS